MKQPDLNLVLTALLALLFPFTYAQQPVWVKHFGNSYANQGLKLAYDGQEGVYGVGTLKAPSIDLDDTTVTVLGIMDIFIAKWDTTGMLLWARTAGGDCQPSGLESAGGVVHDANTDRVIVSGQFDCPNTYFGDQILSGSQNGGKDLFLASYNDAGDCLWARSAVGYNTSYLQVLVDESSNIFAFGWARTAGVTFHGSPAISLPPGGFIAKYASDGGLLDAQRVVVNGELNRPDWLTQGSWALTGSANQGATLFSLPLTVNSTQHDGFVAKTDTMGTVDWVTMFPSNGSASVFRSAALAEGRVAVCGYFVDDLMLPVDTLIGDPGVWTFFIAVLDATGTVEWALPIAAQGLTVVSDLKADPNGEILLYGRYEGNLPLGASNLAPYASTSGFVARFSPDGECLAAWSFGRTYFASGSILPTEHGLYLSSEFDSTLVLGNYTVQGTHTGPDPGYHDLFIARFDSLSGFTSVPAPKVSTNERLHIYANPNNGICTIELPAAIVPGTDLVLTIHDATGRVVQRVPLRWSEGTLQVDIRAQARGIYHAELMDGPQRYSGTIVFE